ncbi:DNA polymerase II large subunit [Candidatus Woesearchaeota archaeon CG10_big_fil_rev_8_21_14_0_10_34_12]|nr:MAG: DNA polymerase II large subunit [Candidatus Woesearchaeota archaeon CG10_big_fil_rev_8_21_14_0_10_34_12]
MISKYFKALEEGVAMAYKIAGEAKSKGLDPVSRVEIPIAKTLAEKVVGLISTVYPQVNDPRIVKRILELEKEYGALDPAVCLKIAEEIAKERYCKFKTHLEAIEAGVRIGLAYTTLGVVSSPIEGFTNIKLKKTKDGKDFFSAYYSGPIRSAGGTAAAFSLIIVDYLRESLGYAKYDPVEEEVKRTVTEVYDYHERITNLQYLPTPGEIEIIAKNIPLMINGEPSEEKEASNYKDLERVETNLLRSGFCLVLAEGLSLKAPKILKIVMKLRERGFKLTDWDFLKEFVDLQKKRTNKAEKTAVYIQDLVAGRPVFGHPSYSGSFRLRYGRTRTSGYSALAVHPATMAILNGFIAVGTQLKIEKPTKGAAVTSCDSIEGPIVKFNNGNVKQITDFNEAVREYKNVSEILYLGDLLVPYGDFLNRNYPLAPAGYCEEFWREECGENSKEISLEKALEFCKQGRPLHPDYIFYWSQISYAQLAALLTWFLSSRFEEKLILPYNQTEKEKFSVGKRALEILGVEHIVSVENVIIGKETSLALLANLGIKSGSFRECSEEIFKKIDRLEEKPNPLLIINLISGIKIRDKAGTFIGARMGRPEKAKLRKLIGSPHVLFPVGEEGGRLRSIQEAVNAGSVKADFPNYFCERCKYETVYPRCEICGDSTVRRSYCYECGEKFFEEKCPTHEKGQTYSSRRIDVKSYLESATKMLGLMKTELPALIKGVRGTSSGNHIPEHLAKGILRAKFNLHVNKDGTIRYDATEIPITHFKAKEVGVDVEKLKSLGYVKDIHGKVLENSDQVLELFPHDVILPSCPDTLDEKAEDVFINIAKFVDLLLTKFYKIKSFYNIKKKEDLVGHLVACIAPHNCAGVVGRIVGFSKTQGLLASPYMHAAMRRDCDGDEAAVMLLLDMLINFSREYLPVHRGGTQDAPLVLNTRIRAGEVDDMIFDLDVSWKYPLELYLAAEQNKPAYEVKIETLKSRVGGNEEFVNLGFNHDTDDINTGYTCSSYKSLVTMQDKVQKQMELVEKARSVDARDVARLVIERHFIRDIRGNLRKFSTQEFRCVGCNAKYRRPPLQGTCVKCNGKIIFTISEGSIMKYVEPAIQLAEKYDVPEYLKQSLDLTKKQIEGVFGKETEKQEALARWF